ncbi:MAG: oligosaccharide flippase family protein, partial [Bacteroidia bacterium]|nr:oligosaccharide flippase family protein [Bacteroidia bacterium]
MGLLQKLASQTAIYGLSSVIGRLLNWGLTPLYVNYFKPGAFGVLSDLYALSFYPQLILTMGMETTFFRFSENKQREKEVYANAFYLVVFLAISFLLVISIFKSWIAQWLGYAGHSNLILIVAGIITADIIAALPLAKLRYDEKAKFFAFISLTNIGITILLNLLFIVVFRYGLYYIFIANLIASIIRTGLALYENIPSWQFVNPVTAKLMLNYGFYIMLAGLAGAINETLDRNLLPRLWENGTVFEGKSRTGMEMNGIYSAMYKLAMFISLVTQAFRYAVEPYFFKSANETDKDLNFARIFHYYCTATLVMFLFISSFTHEILSFNFWGLFSGYLVPR